MLAQPTKQLEYAQALVCLPALLCNTQVYNICQIKPDG